MRIAVVMFMVALFGCNETSPLVSVEDRCRTLCECDKTGDCVEKCIKTMAAAKTSKDMQCLMCRDSIVNCELATGPNGFDRCLGLCNVGVVEPSQDVPSENGGTDTIEVVTTCPACLKPGIAFRLTKLDVQKPEEPAALKDFLNAIWAPDICAQRLNIILKLDEVKSGQDGKTTIKFTAGSGWPCPGGVPADPKTMLQVQCDDPTIVKQEEFCFVEGGTTVIEAVVDEKCHFVTTGEAFLNFHPGPVDHAYICSAGDPGIGLNRDTIPLANLFAYGDFNADCTEITAGLLSGCIKQEAADQICSFLAAPNYSTYDMSNKDSKACDDLPPGYTCVGTAYYCMKNCNKSGWANFGGFTRDNGVPVECTVQAAEPNAYQLSGEFAGTRITVNQ